MLAETRGDDAFGVVGNDDGVRARELARAFLEQTRLRVAADGGRRFVIDAKQLLTLSEDPHLACGLASVADGDQPYPAGLTGLRELPSRLVVARDADERRAPAERHDVRRGVGGAARHRPPAAEADNRHGRFGRDPRRVAVEVLVQHEVADDEDGLVRKTDE